jgi:hypothetical protein
LSTGGLSNSIDLLALRIVFDIWSDDIQHNLCNYLQVWYPTPRPYLARPAQMQSGMNGSLFNFDALRMAVESRQRSEDLKRKARPKATPN